MPSKKPSGKDAMQRFEEFAKRIFSVSKDDVKKAEESIEDSFEKLADEIIEPQKPSVEE